jgi:hypothetical protein
MDFTDFAVWLWFGGGLAAFAGGCIAFVYAAQQVQQSRFHRPEDTPIDTSAPIFWPSGENSEAARPYIRRARIGFMIALACWIAFAAIALLPEWLGEKVQAPNWMTR